MQGRRVGADRGGGVRVPRQPPVLTVVFSLEEEPRLHVLASTHEDELRLLRWAAGIATQARLREAVLEGLERVRELGEAA